MDRKNYLKLNIIAALTVISGLLTLSSTLVAIAHRHNVRIVLADAHLAVIAGLSLIYLAALLRRGKYNAWLISLPVYSYLIARNFRHFVFDFSKDERLIPASLNLLLPALVLTLLVLFRKDFKVRSEIRSFTIALRRSVIILLVAFLYGIFGFSFMDDHDFHQELSFPTAAHYTIDQFGLTTAKQLAPYTKRAKLFLDSLGVVSFGAVFYTGVSFFAPIRFALRRSQKDLADARLVLQRYSLTSEDFFKLWPTDKAYFFSHDKKAFIAYRVVGGVALCVGDPVGPRALIKPLVIDFTEYCRLNDWAVTFIHTDGTNLKLYQNLGFNIQKIGEEALIDIGHFNQNVASNKYFRHINNKFTKQNYSCELLSPPHSLETMAALKRISDDWLKIPGKTERGFAMGYFTQVYIQACNIMVVRDEKGKAQAFLNQVYSYKPGEANYDLLRASAASQTNANDYLMINFIQNLGEHGYERLNMGLSPLTGLGPDDSKDRSAIDNLLHFVYDNADRFYSFQGLARFKSKYEPKWEGRYIIYKGGLPGFSRIMNALLRAMRVK